MIEEKIKKYSPAFHSVVPFEPGKDRLYPFDFTDNNKELSAEEIADTDRFANYINEQLKKNGCRYGIGGYNEHRSLYARSRHFDKALHIFQSAGEENITETEARRL